VIPFVPQQAHSSEVILTGHKARTPATLGIPRKPVRSTYRFFLLLQQIETVLKLEIVYSWLAIVIVASGLNGDVDTDGLDRRFGYDEIPWLLAEYHHVKIGSTEAALLANMKSVVRSRSA
jgi:hypothetical protein